MEVAKPVYVDRCVREGCGCMWGGLEEGAVCGGEWGLNAYMRCGALRYSARRMIEREGERERGRKEGDREGERESHIVCSLSSRSTKMTFVQ